MIHSSMAATYHQSTVPTFQPAVYSLYTSSNNGYITPNIGILDSGDPIQKQQVPSDITNPLVNVYSQSVAMVKSSKASSGNGDPRKKEMRQDSLDKPDSFTCEECGKSVKSRHYLKIHMRIHSGEKPFPCNHCSLSFSIRGNLYKHMRTHSGVKNYACTYCGQMFRDSTSRSRHERLHTGEMPYRCQDCDQSFRYREMYKTHMMSVHGLEENDVVALPPGKRRRSERGSTEGGSNKQGSTDVQVNYKDTQDQKSFGTNNQVKKLKISDIVNMVIAKNNVNLSAAVQGGVSGVASMQKLGNQITVETAKSDQGQENSEMESLNGDDDLTFENTSPDKLMPLELQNQEEKLGSVGMLCHKSNAAIHKLTIPHKILARRLQCLKCPKSFLNKSQLTRHQKMHKLLTIGSGQAQYCNTSGKVAKQVSAKAKQTNVPNLQFPAPECESNDTELPLDLTAMNSSNSYLTNTTNSSIEKVDATFPETYLQESSFQDQTHGEEKKETVDPSHQSSGETREAGNAVLVIDTATETKGKNKDPEPNPSMAEGENSVDGVECNICGRILRRGTYMKAHMRIHSGEKPHVCKICGRGFTVSQNLYKHLRTHTGEKNYACPTCGRKFNTSSSRNRHMVLHSGDKPYPCQLCSEQFQYLDGLKAHCQKYHPLFNLTAGHVRDYTRNKAFEKDFMPLSGPGVANAVSPSSQVFIAQDVAKSILESMKTKIPEFSSQVLDRFNQSKHQQKRGSVICGKAAGRFQDSDRLMFPYDAPMDESKSNVAVETNSSANNHLSHSVVQTKYDLNTDEQTMELSEDSREAKKEEPVEHVEQVSSEGTSRDAEVSPLSSMPHPEDKRDSFDRHASTTNYHGQTSINDKEAESSKQLEPVITKCQKQKEPRVCPVCEVELNSRSYLKDHMKTHTGERPYTCPLCAHSFALRQNLVAHIRNHAGEKRFRCEICGKHFALRNTMERHMLVHTGEKPYECVVCKERFTYLEVLKQHYKRQHPDFDIASLRLKRGKRRSTKISKEPKIPSRGGLAEICDSRTESNNLEKKLLNKDCQGRQVRNTSGAENALELVKPTSFSNRNLYANVYALSRSGFSHRKQAAPMKLPTILCVSEDEKDETNHSPSGISQGDSGDVAPVCSVESKPELNSQDNVEDDFIITVNEQNESNDSVVEISVRNLENVHECSECHLVFKNDESLFIHSQTHTLQDGEDRSVDRQQYSHSAVASTDELQPVSEIMETCNSALLTPNPNVSWSKSMLSAVNHIGTAYPETQYYKSKLAESIASGIQPSKCHICYAIFSSNRKFSMHMAKHRSQDDVTDGLKKDTKINLACGESSDQVKPADTASQIEGSEAPLVPESSTSEYHDKSPGRTDLVDKPAIDVPSSIFLCPSSEIPSSPLTPGGPLLCLVSEHSAASQEDMEVHKNSHFEENQKNTAKKVNDAGGSDAASVKCRHCPGVFASYKDLQSHMKVHEGQPVFNCPLCSCVFAQQDLLMKHLKEHTQV